MAPANFLAWQQQSRTLERMAAIQDVRVNLTGGPNGHIEPEEIKCERVSASLFPLLGVEAKLGRTFREEEDQPGRTNVALLSQSLWQRRFGGDPAIAGKTIRLRDQPYTVVGVLPANFAVLESGVDVFIPLGLDAGDARSANRPLSDGDRTPRGGSLKAVRRELDAVGAANGAGAAGIGPGLASVGIRAGGGTGGRRAPVAVGVAGGGGLPAADGVRRMWRICCWRGARRRIRRSHCARRWARGAGESWRSSSPRVCCWRWAGRLGGLLLAAGAIYLLAHAGPASVPRLAQATLDLRLFGFTLAVAAGHRHSVRDGAGDSRLEREPDGGAE